MKFCNVGVIDVAIGGWCCQYVDEDEEFVGSGMLL